MRNSDGGLQPASNHVTSSSRDCSGVISIWSRAMKKSGYLAIRPNAPCGQGNADGGVRINETYKGYHRAGTPSRVAAALTSEQEQPSRSSRPQSFMASASDSLEPTCFSIAAE